MMEKPDFEKNRGFASPVRELYQMPVRARAAFIAHRAARINDVRRSGALPHDAGKRLVFAHIRGVSGRQCRRSKCAACGRPMCVRIGAGEGNRTLVISLEDSTGLLIFQNKLRFGTFLARLLVGNGGVEWDPHAGSLDGN
jgi:hypothetical protein